MRVLLVLLALAGAPDPSVADGSAQRQLDAARKAWAAHGLTDYRFRLRVSCFCANTDPRVIRVRGGRHRGAYTTVPKLFAVVQRAIDHGAARLTVAYARDGHPRRIYVDRDQNVADEEVGLSATHLRPLAAAADDTAQAELDAAEARWAQQGTPDYSYTVRQSCFCPAQYTDPSFVIVQDGAATNATQYNEPYSTVPKLFAYVQSAITSGYDHVSVNYDDITGVPLGLSIDRDAMAVDDEFGLSITDFQAGRVTGDPSILDGSAQRALDNARTAWERRDLHDYTFRVSVHGVTKTVRVRGDAPRNPRGVRRFSTVPALFTVIQAAIDRPAAVLRVVYGPTGLPRSITLPNATVSAARLREA